MKITVVKYIENDVFKVQVAATDYGQIELQKMASYGEPQIDLGGTFTGPAFTLPHSYARIETGSPFVGQFDVRDAADAEDRADAWATEIVVRLKAAITTLRALTDVYTSESVETY